MTTAVDESSTAELSQAKDRRFFAELLLDLEAQLDVNQIQAYDIKLWPLIRRELARGIKQSERLQFDQKPDVTELRSQGLSGGVEERAELRANARTVVRVSTAETKKQINRLLSELAKLGKKDFVIFSKVEKYYQPVGDRFYAPILDPVYEDLQKFGTAQVLALEPIDIQCVHQPHGVNIEPYMRISTKLQKESPPEDLQTWVDEINRLLDRLAPEFQLDMDHLVNRLNRYRRRVPFFRDILQVMQPKVVFCSSFTGWAPLILAARELGIPTVDIQHGGQSPYHYHTTHWTKVPEDGYELIPDFFWVWGSAIRDYIDPWLPAGASRHVALVGGNRYLAKWMNKSSSGENVKLDAELADRANAAEKVILVTLGYSITEILPDNLVDAIKQTPEWLWLLRLHPINRGGTAMRELEEKIHKQAISNVEYKKSTVAPLHSLLSGIVDHHVTTFSTTSREAAAFNVPSTIVHPIGRTYFADEIETGIFQFAETGDLIVASVRAHSDENLSVVKHKFIETDDALVDEAIRRILAASSKIYANKPKLPFLKRLRNLLHA